MSINSRSGKDTEAMSAELPHKLLPPLLRLAVGSLNAVIISLSKLAISNGVPPLANAFWTSCGAGLALLLIALRKAPSNLGTKIRYGLLAGSVSVALPTALVALVINHIGSGMTSVVYAFPPLLTYLLSLPMGLDRPSFRRFAGILIGLAGALIIVFPPDGGSVNLWMALAMLIPVSLAWGNIYRTTAWPQGGRPGELAAMVQLGAASLLILPMFFAGQVYLPFADSDIASYALLAQMAVTTVMYVLFFMLQKVGGPVYLSQIGYVIVATGLMIGWAVFGENYSASVFAALGLIAAGLYLANKRKA